MIVCEVLKILGLVKIRDWVFLQKDEWAAQGLSGWSLSTRAWENLVTD